MPMQTCEQKRAAEAARVVAGVPDDLKIKTRYNSLVGSLPVMLRTNGILQVAAFLEDKAGRAEGKQSAERLLIEHLEQQLRVTGLLKAQESLCHRLLAAGFEEYLRIQEEAIACSRWQKRFSHARFGEPDPDGGRG